MKIKKRRSALLFLAAGLLFVYQVNSQTPAAGVNFSYMDTTVRPGNDFYTYCNGNWQKSFVLPDSDPRYGSFNEINEGNLKKIKRILDEASRNTKAAPNTDAQRLRDFYNTATDSIKLEQMGFTPIKEQLNRIDSVKTLKDFIALKSEFDKIGIDLLFSSGVSVDLKNSRRYTFVIEQGGLGLGDRDYYFLPKHEEICSQYRRFISTLFTLTGVKQEAAQENAELVFDLEKRIVEKAFTRVERRDLERQYNPYSGKGLSELCPVVNWNDFFKDKDIAPDTVIVGMVDYLKNLNWLLTRAKLENLKLYAKARLLMEAAPYLNRRFVDVHFMFRGRVMGGVTKIKPNWQRAQNIMNATMGDIVSREFVKKHFSPAAKVKVNALIDNLVASYRERINSRSWMSEETKKQANRKLDLLIRKVGYPDTWKNYAALTIKTDSYWANVCRAQAFLIRDNLNDLKKPVDRKKWQMTAVTVNAYYDPTTNEITFPAAILQPPFFDVNADDAANYGTMGSIIGHELTHGFDDQGSQFDADGNMKMWWTETDFQNFKTRKQPIVDQFNSYLAIDTLHVNGTMTQGENIADLGGLTMAYYAYKKSLAGKPSPRIGGFTGEQRFFIAWAQGWKSKVRDPELRRLLTVDYHAPAYFRAFAPLSNMPEFYEAFHVVAGDKLFVAPEKRVEIW